MTKYTVVLLRPDYIADPHYGEDYYVAHVEAADPKEAAKEAQQQLYDGDTEDELDPHDPEDYDAILVFNGHHEVARFGWQS